MSENKWNKKYPISQEEYNKLRDIDRVQLDIMEGLKGCKLDKKQVMNIMLSMAFSIASEDPEPVQKLHKGIEEIQYHQKKD